MGQTGPDNQRLLKAQNLILQIHVKRYRIYMGTKRVGLINIVNHEQERIFLCVEFRGDKF